MPGLPSLPTKTDGSLGRVKTDRSPDGAPSPDLRHDVPAEEFERLKDAVIANATAIGLDDGSTPDSLAAYSGAVVWAWNGVDVSQFEATPHTHNTDLGTSPSGTLSLSVAAGTGKLGNILRVFGSSMVGGHVFGVLTSELTLPDRYLVEITTTQLTNTGPSGGAYIFYNPSDGGGLFQGLAVTRDFNSATISGRLVIDDDQAENLTFSGSGTFNADTQGHLGLRQIIEVHRQNGTAAESFNANLEERNSNGGIAFDGVYDADSASIGTAWNNLDCDRFGIGLYSGASATGVLEIRQLRILTHPWDQ